MCIQAIKRAEQRQRAIEDAQRDESKTGNFLICLHSAPGGGKSFALDVIANIGQPPSVFNTFGDVQNHTDLLKKAKITRSGFLDGAIGLTITHAEGKGPIPGEKYNIDEILGWRFLHS